jgi:hypothetical protein
LVAKACGENNNTPAAMVVSTASSGCVGDSSARALRLRWPGCGDLEGTAENVMTRNVFISVIIGLINKARSCFMNERKNSQFAI